MTNIKIVLIGPQHVGKTSVGKALAQTYRVPFYDTDDLILETQDEKTFKSSIRELYTLIGEDRFRHAETECFKHLVPPFVCATGGGFINNRKTWQSFTEKYTFVLLKTSGHIAWERVRLQGIPSYISERTLEDISEEEQIDIQQKFHTIFENRMREYLKVANIVIDTIQKKPIEIAEEIVNIIGGINKSV